MTIILLAVIWILMSAVLVVGSILGIIYTWIDGGFSEGLLSTPIALIFLLVGILMIVGPIEYHNKVEAHKETCIGADCTDDIHNECVSSFDIRSYK